ncbi:hypothetical protein [Hyphomicrobium denitrificans]|nr:hypothetical protein [Hyphomicrobium denitrificans]
MKSIEVLRTRGLPFSLMTTTHDLLVVADAENNDLFTYCPKKGVMLGLGDFDDRPRMYTPKCLQLFIAPIEDLRRMKREWKEAAARDSGNALPFIPALTEPVYVDESHSTMIAKFGKSCREIEMEGED